MVVFIIRGFEGYVRLFKEFFIFRFLEFFFGFFVFGL